MMYEICLRYLLRFTTEIKERLRRVASTGGRSLWRRTQRSRKATAYKTRLRYLLRFTTEIKERLRRVASALAESFGV